MLEKVNFEDALSDPETNFRNANFGNTIALPPRAVQPPGGKIWLFSSVLRSFKGDDGHNDGDAEDNQQDKKGEDDDQQDKTQEGQQDKIKKGEENKSVCSFCRSCFEGAVHDFQDVAADAMEEISHDMQDRMEEKLEEIVNKAEDHLRSRVARMKNILQKNPQSKELSVVLTPLLRDRANSSTHQMSPCRPLRSLTSCQV